ncbi:hypothetical protein R5R35_003821 [Gryllus longicercus]|uniref:Prophenoloxidase n=1 Tax=Gryllus longicercus TaxID=2509291 RepID=A0AAN9VGM2_9ORTH
MVVLLRQFLASLLVLLLGANIGPGDAEALVVNLGNRSLVPLLLERLNEPVVLPKGDNRNVFFNVPAKYLDSRIRGLTLLRPPYGMLGSASFVGPTQLDNATVEVPDVAVPDLGPALELSREEDFSLFFPRHRVMARHLVDILLSLPTYEKFLCVSAVIRDKVNPYLYAYAMSVAILNRNDTIKTLPNSACLFPQLYFQGSILAGCWTEAHLFAPEDREPIEISRNWTATDLEPEHRVAYFREDIGINLAHWIWHVHNPHSGPPSAVNKDRRGELFYYFHQQIIARYNFERLSTELSRVKRLLNWREPIPEAYFPKLNNGLASRVWPPRQADARLQDVRRSDAVIDILDLERWRDRIMEAIHTGRAYTSTRETVQLDNDQGIDILGNILESSDLSINSRLYGDLHNAGHVVIAYAHDPDFRHLEKEGVMGNSRTALRDPVFFRWHAFVQNVFDEHKSMLPPYTEEELSFSGVHVRRVEVQSVGQEPNELHTFWQKSDYNIERGLDFSSGPVLVRVTHLQHVPFFYRIQVHNTGNRARNGMVRIFLAPKIDERRLPFSFSEQREFFIELDKFPIKLEPGLRTIIRWSNESTVTVDPKHTFLNVDKLPPGRPDQRTDKCNCGWPQHMLIPRGHAEGKHSTLFVMISDYDKERVEQKVEPDACWKGYSYCGLLGHRYPDKRPLGFPLDRLPRDEVSGINDNIETFLTPNMKIADVVLRHNDRTAPPEPLPVR